MLRSAWVELCEDERYLRSFELILHSSGHKVYHIVVFVNNFFQPSWSIRHPLNFNRTHWLWDQLSKETLRQNALFAIKTGRYDEIRKTETEIELPCEIRQ